MMRVDMRLWALPGASPNGRTEECELGPPVEDLELANLVSQCVTDRARKPSSEHRQLAVYPHIQGAKAQTGDESSTGHVPHPVVHKDLMPPCRGRNKRTLEETN